MGLKKFYKRLRKKVNKGVNSLNPFKMKTPDVASPVASALVKRMKKRQGGEGFIHAQVEDYGK